MLVERFLRKFSFVRSLTRIKNSGKQQQIFKFGTYYIGAKVQRTLFWKFGNGGKRFFRTYAILKGFHWALNAIKLKIAFLSSVGRRTIVQLYGGKTISRNAKPKINLKMLIFSVFDKMIWGWHFEIEPVWTALKSDPVLWKSLLSSKLECYQDQQKDPANTRLGCCCTTMKSC